MVEDVIELRGVTKCYGSLKAVDKLDLNIRKGEIYGLLGPNGAGKSTTILMMLGLTEPTEGLIRVCNIDSTLNPIEVKRRVGYLPDNVGFYDNQSGLDNLVFIARLNSVRETEARRRALELLSRVGLSGVANKKVGAYSRGMRQRLGLADVLIKKPAVIILDEPTLGIDPSGVKAFLDLIVQLSREEGLTVLLSSHHLHQVQQVCDRVGIFVSGKLIANGTISELSEQLFSNEAFTVEAAITPADAGIIQKLSSTLEDMQGVSHVKYEQGRLLISCAIEKTAAIARAIVDANLDLTYLSPREYGLDEIYQRYFEGEHKHV
ncbi:ABC transporter ATP-binding protein [Olivibacter sp. XZL3]|uniref:ABC transporter ATP-binding protein n=1 Tax=Olivibacter sp. XZL3 TaxID=1735116 RepID=UPI001F0EB093|nr:ABC transporter ATP-binding protein [Olivibacter sp. XZL3]